MAFIGNTNTTQAFTPAVDYFSGNASTTAFTLSRPVASVAQVQAVIENVPQNPGSAFTVSGNTVTFTSAPPSGTNNVYVYYTSPITQVATLSQAPSVLGPMLVSINGGTALGGATNPIIGAVGSANNYVQLYTMNLTNGANSSADFTAYPSNGTDASGWADMGMTGPTFSQAAYSVTGPNEAYLFGSGPSGTTGTGNLVIATDSTGTANDIQFYTGGFTQAKSAAKMVIQNSTGNVGVGTTSPNRRLEIDSSTAAPLLRLNNTVGGGNNGIEIIYSSSYKSWLIGAGYNIAGGLEFTPSTANGGTTFTTPAVAIDSSGNLLVGQTTVGSSNSNSLSLQGPNNQGSVGVNHASGSTSGTSYCYFGYNASTIGSITQNGTTGVLYNLTSDYRLKNNPVPVTGAKDFVMALQPKTWDWWDGSGKGVGFIAHEFMEVAKYSGHGEKDAVDEEGKIIPQSIQPSSSEVMANLVALMQEQQALITSQAAVLSSQAAVITQLQADVAALKGAK